MDKELLFSRATLFTGKKELELLQNSTVLIAGVGGLGSVVSETLVRRGIGKLIILDYKSVDLPDLNRQTLYTSVDLGKPKLTAAKKRLLAIHPFIEIDTIKVNITDTDDLRSKLENRSFDIIADCLDNFGARYSLESILRDDQYLIHGGVKQDFGQITNINKERSLEKLYGNMKDDHATIPVCPEIVNIIGSLMVNEIVSSLKGKPKLLDKLCIVELADFSQFKIDIDLRR